MQLAMFYTLYFSDTTFDDGQVSCIPVSLGRRGTSTISQGTVVPCIHGQNGGNVGYIFHIWCVLNEILVYIIMLSYQS